MKIKYKRVKIAMPHCGDCGEQLQGNNSQILPYKCSCGTWENSFDDLFNYKLKEPKNQSMKITNINLNTCKHGTLIGKTVKGFLWCKKCIKEAGKKGYTT